jgi:phosphohistidine swiveling domain-containing protein
MKLQFDRKNMYVYPWYISDLTMTKEIEKINGTKVKKAFVFFDHDHMYMYYDSASANQVGENFLKKLLKEKNFYKLTIKNIYKYSEELMDFCQKVDNIKDFGRLSDKNLLKIYEEYMRRLRTLRLWGWVPSSLDGMERAYLSDHLLEQLRSYLEKRKRASKLNSYYSLLTSSEKKSEVQTEELARLDLLLKIDKNSRKKEIYILIRKKDQERMKERFPAIQKLLQQHLHDFGWLTYSYSGPVMDMEYLLRSLTENLKEGNIINQKKKIIDHYKNIKQKKREIVQKLSLPKDMTYIFTVASEFMFIKDYRKGIYQQSYVSMDKIIGEIAKRLDIPAKGIKYMVIDEIREALLGRQMNKYRKIVSERIKRCCYVAQNGEIRVYEGKKADKMLADVQAVAQKNKESQGNIEELRGMVAYPGKVRGIVKIVLEEKDVAKITGGEILVSSATNPDLIIAMKKAGAFVTDTGGIISHAAIVSRELKKPCVVGTKIATHVLKDGDEVEVDAEKGIVKIIKK